MPSISIYFYLPPTQKKNLDNRLEKAAECGKITVMSMQGKDPENFTIGQNDANGETDCVTDVGTPLIKADGVTYSYRNGEQVSRGVTDVSLSINRGEFVVILGRNGSGKSTLAKLLNGFLVPDEGIVTVRGIDTADDDKIFEVRSVVGMVFQNPDNQMVASVIESDVAFGPENLGVPREEIEERITDALETVGMEKYRKGSPNKLSGGQKQRIAIAAILAMRPEVVILDESTAMLDPKGRREIMDTVLKLKREKGMAVVLITHYMDEAIAADRIHIMNDGGIIASGSPAEVFGNEDAVRRAGLELPVAAKISLDLKKAGLDIGFALTDEELAEEICALK